MAIEATISGCECHVCRIKPIFCATTELKTKFKHCIACTTNNRDVHRYPGYFISVVIWISSYPVTDAMPKGFVLECGQTKH